MVDKICNGVDPLYDHQLLFSRSEIAAKLFANSSEKFIKDKKIDVNNDEFKAILDYCKDLPAQSYYEGKDVDSEWENLMTAKENMKVQPIPVYGFFEFEQFAGKYDDNVILGYPSADGRSASIASEIAVSIFSNTKDVESCKKFLSILLSDDIQMSMFMNIPINKNCARQIALNDIEETNKHVADNEGQKYANLFISDFAGDPKSRFAVIERMQDRNKPGCIGFGPGQQFFQRGDPAVGIVGEFRTLADRGNHLLLKGFFRCVSPMGPVEKMHAGQFFFRFGQPDIFRKFQVVGELVTGRFLYTLK